MPQHRTFKSLFVEVVIIVTMFALVGHLSMNFWERFIIQTELSNMKTSLHSLKETVYKIGYAYDNLQRELTGLTDKADQKPPITTMKKETQTPQSKIDQTLTRKAVHDMQMQTATKAKNRTTITAQLLCNKTVHIHNKHNRTTQHYVADNKKLFAGKNVSTITRYPPKSTGVGLNYENCLKECSCCKHKSKSGNHNHKCCKDFDCYSYENWKF